MASEEFGQEYAEARMRFLTASREAGAMVESYILPMQCPHWEQLKKGDHRRLPADSAALIIHATNP